MVGTILVVGGAGFIGSHVNQRLHDNGYKTVVLDNLSRGARQAVIEGDLVEGDFGDRALLEKLFEQYSFDAVMHFAAFTDVGESVQNPALYNEDNVVNTITLLNTMVKHKLNNFIFSSSAAVYGTPGKDQVTETDPTIPINPYGMTKLMVEQILQRYDHDYGIKSCSLRYFNAAGGDPAGIIKNYKKKENNLIPIVLRSLINNSSVTIFGTDYPTPDGTGVRDYIHVMDLADAHILAMVQLFNGGSTTCYNLGNGNGYSVRDVISMAEEVTGMKVDVIEGPRREGDPAILMADATKAQNELGWEQQHPDLKSMIQHAWNSYEGVGAKV
ncbi:MAG: UDP-glucose 4-epimerase [Chlamydiae bacterium]|nr:UDP-glucose 4-epimerase [Chlamydiota bacterium]